MIDTLGLMPLVGVQTFMRGYRYAKSDAVYELRQVGRKGMVQALVEGSGSIPYTAAAVVTRAANGTVKSLSSSCTCPIGVDCKHVVALLIAAFDGDQEPPPPPRPVVPAWQQLLKPIVGSANQVHTQPLGLQFELGMLDAAPVRRGGAPEPTRRLGIRPVKLGAKGRWIRTGISWSNLNYLGYGREQPRPDHLQLLHSIAGVCASVSGRYYSGNETWFHLDQVNSRAIWNLLRDAAESGVALINSDRLQSPVVIADDEAVAELDILQADNGLLITPQVTVDGQVLEHDRWTLLGQPGQAVLTWVDGTATTGELLTLTPLARQAHPDFRRLLAAGPATVPEDDQSTFVRDFLPSLRKQLPVISRDDSFDFPEPAPPALRLLVRVRADHELQLHWDWVYRISDTETARLLYPGAFDTADREPGVEQGVLRQLLGELTEPDRAMLTGTDGKLLARVTLFGMDTVRFVAEVLPLISEWVEVTVEGEAVTYRPAAQAPVVDISGEAAPGRDWFDLEVTITVDQETVPFNAVFRALAAEQDHLILPSGTWFPLDVDQFGQLRRLIEEARQLTEGEHGALRVSRFQVSLFDELQALGVIDAQATAWRDGLRQLLPDAEITALPVPSGLHAELRPYQHTGFEWLSYLFDHSLGGVLADDMGLGKTLQALAMISRAGRTGEPFLVVAPTSVVGNWKTEAARFTPDLTVVTIHETSKKGGRPLAEQIDGADLVITSYALFRLDYPEHEQIPWRGLILDEAQFVKNHQSQAYHCAKKLPVPFKLAITGTPMENHLMELWALFSIATPGLLASPVAFTDYYRKPIEKGAEPELLQQLRRRIRPFMLRRTKEQVAPELPEKQEQVLELELNAKHRKVYQTHLQRERQKVLGLIDDMDKNRFVIFKSLTLLRRLSLNASLIDEQYAGVPSTKLDALMELLGDVIAEGHRTLVFSQFTGFLGKVKDRLDAERIEYCYLDGATTSRQKVLADFKDGTAPVFLISLKAGGFGLNLTEADYVILLDPWWNPATENQAIDRAHRIGQDKKVMVYRLVAKDTIEEKVMALKASKAALVDSVLDDAGSSGAGLTAADIRSLLE